MKQLTGALVPLLVLVSAIGLLRRTFPDSGFDASAQAEDAKQENAAQADDEEYAPRSVLEARARARLLHETLHGALQVMHRDFFDEENLRVIPSKSLEDVFTELGRGHNVKVQWLSVSAEALNIDHKPSNEFEKQAAKALSTGEKEYESVTENSYRYVGSIKLASQCLKCHLPNRTSVKDRAAGLVITMPLNITESR